MPWLRRAVLLVAAALLAACATAADGGAEPVAVPVADGVYMVRGAAGEIGPDNRGRVGNAGFIVGPLGVLVVDSGVSRTHGAELLAAIARVTDKPVRLLVITHARQEFLFGAAAFRERGIPIQMHSKTARLMAARCEGCLRTLQRTLGDEAMRGTAVLKPDVTFDESMALAIIGRPVRLLYFGHGSGPGDVAVLDESSGTLFAGGLLDNGRIPDVQDSQLAGWSQALAALRGLRPVRIVPGHGAAAGPALIDTVERYLTGLQARAAALLDADVGLSQVADGVQLPAFAGWDQYDTIHRRNASIVFLRLEQERLTTEGTKP
jgi:glyoxylase-like metal-dependent hydrolase (beta-lactamase superfamily II)